MADLLGRLEEGVTRSIGAASRLRNQITNIDTYMSTQRQQDASSHSIFHPTTTTSYPTPQSQVPQNTYNVSQHQNPNIDPTLQSGNSSNSSELNNGIPLYSNAYAYSNADVNAGSVNGMTSIGSTDQGGSQFQVPAELLEGWPWVHDNTQLVGGL